MRATTAALFAGAFLFTAGAGPVFAAPASPTPTPAETSRPLRDWHWVTEYKAGKLTYVRVAAAGDRQTVDVSDMTVNVDCAFDWLYGTNATIRILLLEQGCAKLLPGKGTKEEKEAEKRAPKPSVTPATSGSPGAGSASSDDDKAVPDVIGAVSGWFAKHWEVLLSTLLGVGSLTWTVWALYNRQVRVLLLGAPAAGKSGLWNALKDGRSPGGLRPTIGQTRPAKLEPISYGKYTLYPAVTDIAGSEPGRALDELERRRSFRWKRKLVLVVVVSPTPGDQPLNSDGLNHAFINKQMGYMALPCGIVGSNNGRRRPDLVLLFISKFDLVADVPPGDSAGKVELKRITDAFAEHENILQAACRSKAVPFKMVVGSANGWGIDDVKKKLQAVVNK